jgi:hypothetical protein
MASRTYKKEVQEVKKPSEDQFDGDEVPEDIENVFENAGLDSLQD